MLRVGADPGEFKTAFAVVEIQRRARVLEVGSWLNEGLAQNLERLFERWSIDEAIVEGVGRPWNKRIPPEALRRLQGVVEEIVGFFRARGLPFREVLASGSVLWQEVGDLGWRQRLTGLTKPNEEDVFFTLMAWRRAGSLEGRIPHHSHIVDAIGMTLFDLSIEPGGFALLTQTRS
jgi:hypothetical protein